ncbi:hypothetical protein AB7M56_000230 [Bradyrhizobium elkanii]|nr:hypothetical protein [Bradyrhizobium elkanii]MCS3482265.1 hypothetical protein [Bradyrhizobium elkanii]MCS3525047.1 hypothetical protein [Bradyrhizobium elkanii]MCS4075740.1 hypothetical protein [Bradyrhizobium elkanii]MCS4085009.1 hypothetical protein [Bradyrhizobium elkanii]
MHAVNPTAFERKQTWLLKPIATAGSNRCSIRRRRCGRLSRHFALLMHDGASSSWPTSRKMPGKATRANRIALEAVRRFDALFEVERAINGRGADERRAVRQEESKPLLEDMHAWLLRERETLSRSSEVLKPINYMLRRWDDFARFLDDGRICLTTDGVEKSLPSVRGNFFGFSFQPATMRS